MGLANIQAYHLRRSCGGKQSRRATALKEIPGGIEFASASTCGRHVHRTAFPLRGRERFRPCLMKRNRLRGFNRDPQAFQRIGAESLSGGCDQWVTERAAVGVQALACPAASRLNSNSQLPAREFTRRGPTLPETRRASCSCHLRRSSYTRHGSCRPVPG